MVAESRLIDFLFSIRLCDNTRENTWIYDVGLGRCLMGFLNLIFKKLWIRFYELYLLINNQYNFKKMDERSLIHSRLLNKQNLTATNPRNI